MTTRWVSRARHAHAEQRGFTLLEVLVAVAILGLGLTIVLSAQTGVFWSYARARHLSQAPGLVRCKMAEVQVDLLQLGFPLLDEKDDGPCCDDEDIEGYSCEWEIQKVKLPDLPLDDPLAAMSSGADAGAGPSEPGAGLGALGTLASIQQTGGSALGAGAGVGDLADALGGGGMMGGIGPMVMGFVYPDLKLMLEASIRKVIVTVRWKEGINERTLAVTQYVTNPQVGGFDPLAADGLADTVEGAVEDPAAALSGLLPGSGPQAPGAGAPLTQEGR